MGEKFSEKRLDAIVAKCQRYDYLRVHYPRLEPAALCGLYLECMYFGQQALRTLPGEESTPILSWLKRTIAEYPLRKDVLRTLKMTHRLWLQLAVISFPMTCHLRNLLRIGC